jgi:hypothetical protein
MARGGLRMMPTFPWPSLKFRTAGFPQFGFKAGSSDKALPDATAVHTAPRPPASGSTLSLAFLPDMPSSTTPGRFATGLFQTCGSDIGLRYVMNGALSTILQSASRRADFWGLPGSLLLRPGKLLAPCADLTRVLPAIGTFTSRLPTSRSQFSPWAASGRGVAQSVGAEEDAAGDQQHKSAEITRATAAD